MLVNINSNEPFLLFTVRVNKCGRNCNTIDDPYAQICVQDVGGKCKKNFSSARTLYLVISKANGYIEETNGNNI